MDKKLTLKKETLKNLSADQLRNVAGGLLDVAPNAAASVSLDGCNVL